MITPEKRINRLFDRAKVNGLISHMHGDGAPTRQMVIDTIREAENDARAQSPFQNVRDFVEKFKTRESQTKQDRAHHIDEEYREWFDNYLLGNREKQIDGLIDLMYVSIGMLIEMDVDIEEAWNRVHSANMAKELIEDKQGHKGNIIKPKGWKAPDLSDL